MTHELPEGQNFFPAPFNYPVTSFPQPVPAPDVDPDDEGTLFYVRYSWEWQQVLLAAVDQLLNPATWQGDADAIRLALNRATNLKDMLQIPVALTEPEVEAPYWDDENGDDSELELPPNAESWFGYLEGANFVDNLAGWVFTGAVALAFGVDAAIEFATGLKKLRLLFRTGSAGAIVQVIVDGVLSNEVDTYSPETGLIAVDVYPSAAPAGFRAQDVGDPLLIDIKNTGTGNPLATPIDGLYEMAVIKKRLWEAELSPKNLQYNPDTDTVQITIDDGATWLDSPGSDPRRQILLPPRSGSDVVCDSAANIIFFLQQAIDSWMASIDNFENVVALIGAINVAVGVLFFAPAILLTLAAGLADALLEVGQAAIDGAFDETTYGTLQCILLDHMDAAGALDQDRLEAVLTDGDAQLNPTASTLLRVIFKYIGFGGLTDAGRRGAVVGDCSDCLVTWCKLWNPANGWDGWTPLDWFGQGGYATLTDGVWHSGHSGDGRVHIIALYREVTDPVHLTQWIANSDVNQWHVRYNVTLPGFYDSGTELTPRVDSGSGTTWDAPGAPVEMISNIVIFAFFVDQGFDFTLNYARFLGRDETPPYGADDCGL